MLTTELLGILSTGLFGETDTDQNTDDSDSEADQSQDTDTDDLDKGDDKDEETVPIADLRKVRREAAKYRKEGAAIRAELDALKKSQSKAAEEAELANLEENERYKKQAELAEAKIAAFEKQTADALAVNATLQKKIAVQNAAVIAGFANPEDASVFVKLSDIEIVDGEVDMEAVTEAVAELAEKKDYLLLGEEEQELRDFGGSGNPKPGEGPGLRFTDKDKTKRLQDQLNADRASHKVEGSKLFARQTEIYDSQSGGRVQADRDGRPRRRDADRIARRTRNRGG